MASETIYLDGLDGFGFERVCERIFKKAGWGKVTHIGGVADRGRDLIIHTPTGKKIVVECKLYGRGSVGRPIVQKLHSAVIDEHADSGIIVTTGKFTKDAIEYAANLTKNHDKSIEMFDLHKIMELAHKAGIELETGRMKKIYTYQVVDSLAIAKEVSPLIDDLVSHPAPASNLLRISGTRVKLRAMYFASISVQQSFSTSVGLIHRIDVRDMPCLFDGKTGVLRKPAVVHFFGRPSLTTASLPEYNYTRSSFDLDDSTLRRNIIQTTIEEHTAHIEYQGRNNQTYVKKCTPSARNIHIDNLRQVYVPRYYMTLRALGCSYSCHIDHNGIDSQIHKPTWTRCYQCGSDGNLLLCNECGRVAHTSWFGAHGFRCRECSKTVCGSCVWKTRRLFLFKSHFCRDCKPDGAKR